MHLNEHTIPASIRPQNPSCPAGGTNTAQSGGRGVAMTSPSSNTSPRDYVVLHRGFDTLALSVKATLPNDLYTHLMIAKAEGEDTRKDTLTEWNGVQLHVKAFGVSGYSIVASGGLFGATWFFKKANAKDPWAIRVSFGSDFLANCGLGAAKVHLEFVLERFGVSHAPDDISIGRADYCVDILARGFVITPDHFVMPASTKRKDYPDLEQPVVHGTSGKASSVTIGHIGNRQVILYDKRAEVIVRKKTQWWKIWQTELDNLWAKGLLETPIKLDKSDPAQSRVIRVEFRAGKNTLKNRWNITTWSDFFDRFGDVCCQMGEDIRYCDPNAGDINRARWPTHPLWEIACAEMNDDLFEMRSGVDPCTIKEVHKETHISMLLRNITGTCLTHAALHDREVGEIPAHLHELAHEMCANLAKRPDNTHKQLEAAKAKYVFIKGPEKNGKANKGN